MAKVNMQERLAIVNAFNAFDVSNIGLKLAKVSPDAARKYLAQTGADIGAMSDKEALVVYTATQAMNKADNIAREIALLFGTLSAYEVWKTGVAPDGKPYKSENAYLKGRFPGYAVSTTSIYADVGRNIYLPIKEKNPAYAGLEWMEQLSPSAAKFLLAAVKNENTRPLLPAAYEEAKAAGPITNRAVANIAKTVKEKAGLTQPRTADETQSDNAADVADQLTGNAMGKKVREYIIGEKVNDELQLLIPEEKVLNLIATLMECAKNADNAAIFCGALGQYLNDLSK